jgi:hypothetical protein
MPIAYRKGKRRLRQLREVTLKLISLFGSLPIIALEPDIEPQVVPYLDFIVCHCDVRCIDEAHVANDPSRSAGGMTGVMPLCSISTSSATTPTIK